MSVEKNMNPYDEDLKPGDRLTFTDELELHLADLGIDHSFEYGDELIVLADEWQRHYPILLGDPNDLAWRAWVFRTIAENAHDFWLKQRELEPENEGVSSPLPLKYWYKGYSSLTPEQRQQISREHGAIDDPAILWNLLTDTGTENFE